MSEWIDFLVYSLQVLLFWVLLPRQGTQFALPMIADRNPDWIAGHRDVAARLEGSRWLLNAFRAWGALSIAALLAVALDLVPAPFGGTAPKWEVLKDLNSMLLIVGMLFWFVCALLWFRWLGTHVPLAETRRATLKPRVVSDYLSWSWRIGVEVLTALHLCAWVVIGVLGLAGGAKYWSGFAVIVVMTVLFAVVAAATPRRPPGYPDRLFGESYRRVELRVAYVFRLVPLIPGGMLISEQAFGVDPDRIGNLLLVSLINAVMLVFLSLRPLSPPSPRFGADSRLSA